MCLNTPFLFLYPDFSLANNRIIKTWTVLWIFSRFIRKLHRFESRLSENWKSFRSNPEKFYWVVIWMTRGKSKKMQPCAKFAARAKGKGCIARATFFYFCSVSFILFFFYTNIESWYLQQILFIKVVNKGRKFLLSPLKMRDAFFYFRLSYAGRKYQLSMLV